MKLSKAQEWVMKKAYSDVDKARACETYEEYFINVLSKDFNGAYDTPEKMQAKDPELYDMYREFYEKEKAGIVLTQANSRTLVKLEQLGLIKIIHDSNGCHYGIDKIEVLNY